MTGVLLDSGEELACEIVCIGKGVRPNVEFLAGSNVQVDGGVVADEYTACNAPGVYTAGDVAVTFDPITGERMMTALWTNAVEMGRCAGRNMAGRPTAYGGTFGILNATQVAETCLLCPWASSTRPAPITRPTCSARPTTYRKLVFTATASGSSAPSLWATSPAPGCTGTSSASARS